jgi:anti-sigma B factor antagonist
VPSEDGRLRVVVRGELDLATAGPFEALLRTRLAAGEALLVDFSETAFMDSSGVRALHSVVREAAGHGWTLAVASDLSAPVRQVLELTQMLALLPIEDHRKG